MPIQTMQRSGLVALCLVASATGLAGAQEQSGWAGGAPRPLLSPSSDATQETQPTDPFVDGRAAEGEFWRQDESAGFAGNLDEWFSSESDPAAAAETWPDQDLQTQDLSGVLITGEDEVYPTTAPSTEQTAEEQPSSTVTAPGRTMSPIYSSGAPRSTAGRISGGRGGVTVTGASGGGGGSGGGHANFSLGSSGGGGSASAGYGGGGGSGGVTGRPSGQVVTAGSNSGSVNVVTGGTSSSGTITHGQSSGSSSVVTGNAPKVDDPTAIDRGRNEHSDDNSGSSGSAGGSGSGATIVGPGTGGSNGSTSSSGQTQPATGSGSSSGATNGGIKPADPLAAYRPAPNRVVAWMTIGWSTVDPATRNISRGLKIQDIGWSEYIRRLIEPQIQWGCRRFLLHNPFGTTADEVMELDQRLLARQAGLTWLERDFVSAWKDLIDRQAAAGDPVEVIAYFGTPRATKSFVKLYEAGDRHGWLLRAWQCVQPAVDAGMSVALDMATGTTTAHPNYEFVQQLKARGVRVYLEGIPSKDSCWFNDNIIMGHSALNAMPLKWSCVPSDIKGELMIIQQPPQGETWQDQHWVYPLMKDFLVNTDFTPAGPVRDGLMYEERTLDGLLTDVARARRSLGRPAKPIP